MKRLLTTVLAFSVALILIHSSAVFGEVPTGKLELLTLQDIYHNGDKIFIEGKGFAENDELVAVALVVYNDDGSIDYKILKNHDLLIDFSGNLAGFAIIEGIDETDKFAQFAISTKYSSVVPTKKFAVQGDLSPFSNQMITGAGDFPSIEAGNFSFTEAGGDNIADLNERFDIVTPNIGWTPDVFLCFRREYSTGDGSGTPIASVSLPIADLEIVGIQLQGFVNNGSTAYNTLTQTMRLDVMDGTFLFGTSTNYFRTFADVIPPNLASAYATDLNTIRLVFDEEVNEIGALDASYKFDFGGTVTGVTASSISPVGSQPTDTWDLTISGLTNRDVGDLTIRYDSTNTSPSPPDTGVLEDAAGNEVKGNSFGSYITVQDSISPATPVLTAPIDSAYFEGGTVDWSATAESGSQDPSISFLELQGSNNGSNWVNTGSQDTDTGDENYSGSFTLGTQYAYYRVRAVDDQGNESFSGSTINYQNAHHISITSSPISEPVGTFEDQVTFQVRDAYGNAENVTQTFPLSMVAGTGTGSFRLTPTGGTITFVNLSGAGRRMLSKT